MEFKIDEKLYLPIIYLVLATIIYNFIKVLVKRILKTKGINKKKTTIVSLIKNILKYVVYCCAMLAILGVYGVDTTGIITSLGIAGLVIGLALQDIIRDFLAGILIIFDNRYSIGDVISIGTFKGEVINFGLMSTKIRSASGEVKILSNSSFKEVVNFSIVNSNIVIDIDVNYATDINKLESVLKEIESDVLKINSVVGNYNLLGISEFLAAGIRYSISLECLPNSGVQVKRDINKLIRDVFKRENIRIAYDKTGE